MWGYSVYQIPGKNRIGRARPIFEGDVVRHPPPNPYPVRLTTLSGCVSRLRYRGPSVYRADSSLIRSPSGVERTAGPPPRVWARIPTDIVTNDDVRGRKVPGAPKRVTPGLTLSVAMLPCLSFWPRPLECKVVPGIAGGAKAPAHSGIAHALPELPHLSLSELTTAPSAFYRSHLVAAPIILMPVPTYCADIPGHIPTADKRGYQPFLTQRRPSHLKPGGHLFRGFAPLRRPP